VFVTAGDLDNFPATRTSNGDATITRMSAFAATPRSF
jgi:hypothetical protein